MRVVSAVFGVLLVAASIPDHAWAAEDANQYVRKLLSDMVDVSKHPTRDRRVFYEKLLANEVDWSGPAVKALGSRWQTLPEDDRRKLAEWSRDSVIGTDSVMTFVQNLIFQSCAITSRSQQSESGASMRIACTRFGGEPNFVVRFDVTRPSGAFQITDIGYNGISLREELSKEILKEDAVAKHGVRADAIAVKQ
jgi:ABC-type transporter MlaC component